MSSSGSSSPTESCITLDDVWRVYDGPSPVVALQACSISVNKGEYVSIVGPSGSGKSTLLSILGVLDMPTRGTYELNGVDVAALSEVERDGIRSHEIGFVFQSFHLLSARSVRENIELGLLYQGVPRDERIERARDAAVRVGLEHRLDAVAETLSGGEKQRAVIARALVRQPAVLLCDEPTGNLDSSNASRVMELLGEINSDGQTVLVITHDAFIAQSAGRTLSIVDGRVAG